METRANYVVVGAFALSGFLGILGFFLWFANLQLDRQFAYFDVFFDSVSGLSNASDVRFAGLPVGQVVDVRLSPANDGRVRVRLEVSADTPVRTDSVATIESQGVTGVAFVGISAGTPDAPLLEASAGDEFPQITAGQSVLQSLSEDAPEILAETLRVVRDLRQLIGGENQERVAAILDNVERSSAAFAQTLDDFSEVTGTVSVFAAEIDRFNETLDTINVNASSALTAVENTLTSVDLLTEDARRVLGEGSTTLSMLQDTVASAERYISEDLGPATVQLNTSLVGVEERFAALSDSADTLFRTYSAVGETANERLTEARITLDATNALIRRIDETLASVDAAARGIDGLVADGATPLLADLRTATAEATRAIAVIGDAAETELPEILQLIRTATASASGTIERVGADLSSASGRLDALSANANDALTSAQVTFANANASLAAINAALVTGDRTLQAAERAFDGADRVINDDIGVLIDGLRETLARLDAAIGQVAEDIPAVTEDLRAASRSAETAFAQIETTVSQSAPGIRDFSTTALPQYGRLAVETRELIRNLDALVVQIRRDPGRFLLQPRSPEFRR